MKLIFLIFYMNKEGLAFLFIEWEVRRCRRQWLKSHRHIHAKQLMDVYLLLWHACVDEDVVKANSIELVHDFR